MACAFCGSDAPLTQEHLWPEWAGRILAIRGDVTHRQHFVTVGSERTVREYRRPPWRVTVGAVCAGCNNGWMSRLESEAKRYAEDLLVGRARELHREGQATLAMWATVKVLVAEYTVPESARDTPAELLSLVYERRDDFELPAETFEIHTAAYGGNTRPAFYERTSMWINATDKTSGRQHQFPALTATFAVGRLALRVLAHTMPQVVHEGFPGPRASSVRRLWPSVGSFSWPPGPALDEGGLDWFAHGTNSTARS